MKMKLRYRYLPALIVLLLVGPLCQAAGKARQITPADTLPKTTPWDLKALSAAPAYKWTDSTVKGVRALHFTGEAYKGKPTRVFAYYSTPGTLSGDASKDKNLPAVVLVHGGGGRAFDKWAALWAKRGYAAISMDLGGCGPGKKRLKDGGPDQGDGTKFGAIDQPNSDQWTYHAVANVILAHSLIQSFKEVDADRTALTGISWGGYLTCIVSGLDNRFKASVPVYGCGFLHENSCWLGHFKKMSDDNRAKWVRLWDPSSYAGSAVMPVLFVNGGADFAYPPDSHAKTAALVKALGKNMRFAPNLRHGHIFDRPKAIEVFINHHLKGGVVLPLVGPAAISSGKATATVKTKTKLTAAALHYTTAKLAGNNRGRKWTETPATIEDNRITAAAPPKEATAWFITVTDDRKLLVSSELVFPEKSDK
ncbi:MAG: acetylxylan esterase [Phycisphaerae bacterium]|jgi:cephalosporin-C deacetylase-like acetyl esterase|nr:acetylxylan esterase [Phycisphaerae bacterium]